MLSVLVGREYQSTKKKIATILALAIPAVIENFLQTAVGFVDTMFVSKLGITSVTAVGVSNTILGVYMAVFMALGVGTSSLIARSVGAGELDRAREIAKQSTWVAIVLGLVLGLITLFFAEPLLRIMGAESKVLDEAALYFRIVAIPTVLIALMFIAGSILRATGDTVSPMKVTMWINILHIPLDYLLIFGIGPFEGFGIAGAAWATVIVRLIGTVALYRIIRRSKVSFPFVEGFAFRNRRDITGLLKLSTPTAIERLVMRLGQVLYFGLIVRISTETFAAHTIAGSIEQFSYMPGYGLAIAATTLVGQNIGAKREKDAYSYGMLTAWIGVGIMSVFGILFLFLLSPWFAAWFTTDNEVSQMVVSALRIATFAQPFVALSFVLAGALQGLGDTKSPMYSTAVGMWVIRVIGVYVLAIIFDLGIVGVWLSFAFDNFARAIFLLFRFKSKFPH
ncbi:MAG: MATE family efflux transporter [Tumebacillaceae bacterium]